MIGRPDAEIRPARPEDVDELMWIWRIAFNVPPDPTGSRAEQLRGELDGILVAADTERILGTARGIPILQWFGGRPITAVGVAGVATHPLARGGGVGSAVVAEVLRGARDEGSLLASLYPATIPVYRRLGFELAGVRTSYRAPVEALPPGDASSLEELREPDEGLRSSFRRLAERENGLAEGTGPGWWDRGVFGRMPGEARSTSAVRTRAAAERADLGPDGYAVYWLESLPTWGYRVLCSHLVWHTQEAAAALLQHFRRFRGLGQDVEWFGPPSEPLALLLPEQSIQTVRQFRFMGRLLDVAGALAARGYPTGEGEAEFGVVDRLLPENAGRYRVRVDGNGARAERVASDPGPDAIEVGVLTAMFTGYLAPRAAAAAGLVNPADPALPVFERLFVGPPPWMPDFF